ncbi:MAG: lysine--tRNA ligase [Candidatus Pacebacteria bacterium]|nr:lysine--tRNA ligase [Candidatus Paceibacterota bacterium]
MSTIDEIKQARLKKLETLKEKGINPYPAESLRELTLADTVLKFEDLEKSAEVKWIGGRIMSLRGQGAIMFVTLFDGTASFQGLLKKDVLGDEKFDLFSDTVDIGDFVEIQGTFFVTKRGEKTCEARDWRMLTKTLQPLPEKWHGITDDDERYRKRYLDVLMNPDLRDLLEKKSRFWKATRDFMLTEGFLEVETPTLEVTTGGAEARPFKTHHNDYDMPVYLRISVGELWQKRLMSAGFPKTFEIGRVYRNEGSSPDHLQEFTNMEFYWAYADYKDGMELVEKLYKHIAQEVFGTTKFSVRGHEFDLADAWPRIDYRDTVLEKTGIDILSATLPEMEKKAQELGIKYEGQNRERLIDTLWKYCRKTISGPAFLVHHPKIVSPLSKSLPSNPDLTERFQPLIAGSELGNGFSELNDPVDQRERFELQQQLIERGDDEAMMPEWEFVEMLEHGMPPTCGYGFGERLFAILAGQSIRETVMFPLMKPHVEQSKEKEMQIVTVVINTGVGLEPWQVMNTVAHLSASFAGRSKKNLFKFDSIKTGDNKNIKLNIQHAIMIKKVGSSDEIRKISESAENENLEVSHFTKEMIETTNDNKVVEWTKAKNYKDVDFLGVLVFGPKSKVEEITKNLELY